MRVYGLKGEMFTVEFTVRGTFDMRSHTVQVKESMNDTQLKNMLTAACASKARCSTGEVEIYQVFRTVR